MPPGTTNLLIDAFQQGDTGRLPDLMRVSMFYKNGLSLSKLMPIHLLVLHFLHSNRHKCLIEMLELTCLVDFELSSEQVLMVLNTWLTNLTGKPDTFSERDLCQEHMNKIIKVRALGRGG